MPRKPESEKEKQPMISGMIGKVEPIALVDEMQTAYIDYAMSVIVSRALPDVSDGL